MTITTLLQKAGLAICIVGGVLAAIGGLMQSEALWQPGLVMLTAGFAVGAGYWPALRSYQFTLWIIAGFVAAMTWSMDLIVWGGFNITHKWIVFLVIQATMFSMGTKLTIQDFIDVAKMPWAVFIGTFCHFVIMPLLGLTITLVFDFPPEVAVGILLIGACPSGLSSTVMVYIANANLALAVSIAAVSTLAATFMTPLWVNLLAGSMIDIQLTAMVMDVVKIVLIPIGAAILHDYLKTYAGVRGRRTVMFLAGMSALWLVYMSAGGWDSLFGNTSAEVQMYAVVLNFVTGGIVWSVFYNWLYSRVEGIKKIMPTISMIGIIFFTTTAAAAGRDNLLQVGFLLCFAMLLHNLGGFLIGYLMSRWIFRMDEQSARTVAFEVGLQNGGMASGLAAAMGKLATVGLASAVMTPLGNVSGSLLANYWRKKDARKAQTANTNRLSASGNLSKGNSL
ncbi:TPA: bile acid:sodium symporter family protein [Escherichia coli]|nr:bile acid:sodium symporter family protein [Escherichia coli]EHD2966781.1 bile acid:sodium symporter family protein [Escherichia coli]EKJ3309102.1 bile acid:sodium symporter family protein [Escherichia coli]EKM4468845.1 bile acid:sodium symporter family protein [Escherichia coli]NJB25427.1 bile acid:sodium symporter family protein [Escherichia coli]